MRYSSSGHVLVCLGLTSDREQVVILSDSLARPSWQDCSLPKRWELQTTQLKNARAVHLVGSKGHGIGPIPNEKFHAQRERFASWYQNNKVVELTHSKFQDDCAVFGL